MDAFGTWSYGAAALAYLALAALFAAGWRGRSEGLWLIGAVAATALWATTVAVAAAGYAVPARVEALAELLRGVAWLAGLSALLWARRVRLVPVALAVLGPLVAVAMLSVDDVNLVLVRSGLAFALLGLIALEQVYRNAAPEVRGPVRFLVLGVGVMFAYDLFLYSYAELFRGVDLLSWQARGLVLAASTPFIAVAARRMPQWSLDVFVSRHVTYYGTTVFVLGLYLIAVSLIGYVPSVRGGGWGQTLRIVFLIGALAVVATLILSGIARKRLRVFISKHFYRNKYDYRVEWLRFVETLSESEEADLDRTVIRAVAQIFEAPAGVLYLEDDSGRAFAPAAAWPIRLADAGALTAVRADAPLIGLFAASRWIVDVQEYARAPEIYGHAELPAWLRAPSRWRIASPIFRRDRLVGFLLLHEPPAPFDLTFEDRDLLATAGQHVATLLAQKSADRKLAELRQFEAYNRLTAFMMHDLKNSVAQLRLLVDNAARHKHNPAFIDDAIGTIANTAERIGRLIEHLQRDHQVATARPVAIGEIVRAVVARCADRQPQPTLELGDSAGGDIVLADTERLTSALEHIIRNAQDATRSDGQVSVVLTHEPEQIAIVVSDTGAGMDDNFVRWRLFRPFDSTKGSKGMGIGAFQVREYVRSIGGDVEVSSTLGSGTRFAITLPIPAEVAT